jgi:hypothetical protein
MGEARRRKLEGTYPEKGSPDMTDDEERQHFLNLPEVRAFAESPEGQRLLRPITMKFLADIGVAPQVDEETGQVVINPLAVIEKLGLDPDEELEKLGDAVRTFPSNRLKPLQ